MSGGGCFRSRSHTRARLISDRMPGSLRRSRGSLVHLDEPQVVGRDLVDRRVAVEAVAGSAAYAFTDSPKIERPIANPM